MRKFEIINGVAPYNPLARSLTNVERSSRKAGTYATAMKDMKAEPKNYEVFIVSHRVRMLDIKSMSTHNSIDERLDILLRSMQP